MTALIWPAEGNLHKEGYFAFKGCGYSCLYPTGEGLHAPNSSGLLQQAPKRDTGIQQGSDMAATNPEADTTLSNVRLAENFNDF